MSTTKKDLVTKASQELLEQLRAEFPSSDAAPVIMLPRLGMFSQDQTEGKGKAMKVVSEAGTFFIDKPTDEENEEGKKVWAKEELGNYIEGIIIFQRKQLRFYDSGAETFTSSPVYDNDNEVVPLFCNGQEVARGVPADLQKLPQFQGVTAKGKATSKLEVSAILYVLFNDELYQMNLRGSSLWSFQSYKRKVLCPAVLTSFSSTAEENGSISWNKMSFEAVRDVTQEEAEKVLEHIRDIKDVIVQQKMIYSQNEPEVTTAKVVTLEQF